MRRAVFVSLVLAGLLSGTASGAALARKAKRTTAVRKHKPKRRGPQIDPTVGDNVDGEDLVIRQAAIAALGPVNGSVVVVDPTNGRILSIVNQKLALKS